MSISFHFKTEEHSVVYIIGTSFDKDITCPYPGIEYILKKNISFLIMGV